MTSIILHVQVFRALSEISRFQPFFNTFWQIWLPAWRLGGVLLLIGYVYAQIGIANLGGLARTDNQVLLEMPYGELNYFCFNFNDFPNSIMTLFVIMVKDWVIISDAYQAVSEDSTGKSPSSP